VVANTGDDVRLTSTDCNVALTHVTLSNADRRDVKKLRPQVSQETDLLE
jgi:hypothetical protein